MIPFEQAFGWLLRLTTDREQGIKHAIPYPFERLTNAGFYGFERGQYNIITAHSGVGKTHITKYLTVINAYFFAKIHNLDVKVFYFALEESEQIFSLTIMSHLLNMMGMRLSAADLRHKLTKEQLDALKKIEEIYKDMLNYIEVIDNVSNGFGIYKHVRTHIYNENTIIYEDGSDSLVKEINFTNPNAFRFVVVDHIGLLSPEKDRHGHKMKQWESIGYYSKEYCLINMCKRLHCTIVNVQQQEQSKEKKEFTRGGALLDEKLEPSPDGLANNKETQREAHIILGLFSPARHDIDFYRGQPVVAFKDNLRSLKILKDRWFGMVNSRIPLMFDGAVTKFEQAKHSSYYKDMSSREQMINAALALKQDFLNKNAEWHLK